MDYKQIITSLSQKQYKSVYLLTGDEPYYIDKISDYIAANALTEEEKSFNQMIFYGKDSEASAIINTAKRFPMMAQYQVVILKEAQELRDIEQLHYYTEKPLKSTILVICYKYKSLDKRKKLYKSVLENGVVFESKKIYDNQVAKWIQDYVKELGMSIQPPAAVLMGEHLGADLSRIATELDKLQISLGNETMITSQHVADNIGISKDFNTLELQNALINNDVLKAFRIVEFFAANPSKNPFVLTIGYLYSFFSKLLIFHSLQDKSKQSVASALKINPYFVTNYQNAARRFPFSKVEQVISLLRQYDLKSKGIGNASVKEGELLRELVYKILN